MAAALSSSFTPLLMPIVLPDIGIIPLKNFYQSIVTDNQTCIDWLRDNGLLASGMICKCGAQMKIGKFTHAAEDLGWRCPEKQCTERLHHYD